MNDRFDCLAVAHDQRADALGGADLVAGDGEERAIDVAERDRDLAERLNGVRMEQDARVATSAGDVGHRLHRADLVVHPHHADQRDALVEDAIERTIVDETRRRHGQNDFFTAEVLHGMSGGQRRLVLGGGHGDAEWAVPIASGERGADDREIVRFRAA